MKKKVLTIATAAALVALAGFSVHANTTTASTTQGITQTQAEDIALKDAGVSRDQVDTMYAHSDLDNGISVYDVEFTADGYEYDYEIKKQNGRIVKQDKEAAKTNVQPLIKAESEATGSSDNKTTAADSTSAGNNTAITKEEAKAIALKDAGLKEADALFVKVEEDYEKGQLIYDVEFYGNGREYDYESAKNDGTIVKKDSEIDDDAKEKEQAAASVAITMEKAKSIALAKVSGAGNNNIEIELDEDDGQAVYEGEIRYQGKEYEFKINARNGAIIEWEVEAE